MPRRRPSRKRNVSPKRRRSTSPRRRRSRSRSPRTRRTFRGNGRVYGVVEESAKEASAEEASAPKTKDPVIPKNAVGTLLYPQNPQNFEWIQEGVVWTEFKPSDQFTEEDNYFKFQKGIFRPVGLPDVFSAIKRLRGSILLKEFDGMIPVDDKGNFKKDGKTKHDCQYRIKTEFGSSHGIVTTKIYRHLRSGNLIKEFEFTSRLVEYYTPLIKKKYTDLPGDAKEANEFLGDTSSYQTDIDVALKVHQWIQRTKTYAGTPLEAYL